MCCEMYRELGIGIVPYSPLGRGFFAGKAVAESIPANSHVVCLFFVLDFVMCNSSYLLGKSLYEEDQTDTIICLYLCFF